MINKRLQMLFCMSGFLASAMLFSACDHDGGGGSPAGTVESELVGKWYGWGGGGY
ncbi:MAG: hypothetical protein LBJ35_00500 [Spirochaetaceae bacterium]|nr:hypothetical protein [Spirochaetaceae bacterium]